MFFVSSYDLSIPCDIVGMSSVLLLANLMHCLVFVTADVDCVDCESRLSPEPDHHYLLDETCCSITSTSSETV
jgi:hypothetical protein